MSYSLSSTAVRRNDLDAIQHKVDACFCCSFRGYTYNSNQHTNLSSTSFWSIFGLSLLSIAVCTIYFSYIEVLSVVGRDGAAPEMVNLFIIGYNFHRMEWICLLWNEKLYSTFHEIIHDEEKLRSFFLQGVVTG